MGSEWRRVIRSWTLYSNRCLSQQKRISVQSAVTQCLSTQRVNTPRFRGRRSFRRGCSISGQGYIYLDNIPTPLTMLDEIEFRSCGSGGLCSFTDEDEGGVSYPGYISSNTPSRLLGTILLCKKLSLHIS